MTRVGKEEEGSYEWAAYRSGGTAASQAQIELAVLVQPLQESSGDQRVDLY